MIRLAKNKKKNRTKKKNILYVGPFPPHQRGGGEYVAHSVAKAMKKRGLNVFVLSMGKDKFFERYEDDGIKVYRVDKFYKDRKQRFSPFQLFRYFTVELFNPLAFLFTLYIILRHRIDAVHISSFHQISVSPLIAAKFLYRKTLITFHSHELFCFMSSLTPKCYNTGNVNKGKHRNCGECILNTHKSPAVLEKSSVFYRIAISVADEMIKATLFFKSKVAGLADHITFPSEYLRDYYVRHGIDANKTKVIYNFLQNPGATKINTKEFKEKWGIKNGVNGKNEKVILFVGNMIKYKGPQILLDAFSTLRNKKNLKLVFVGYGELVEKLKRRVSRLNLDGQVVFTDWVSRENLMSAYELADVVVIPSIFPETFSLVFLEAFAARKIVVASEIGALSDNVVDGKTGFLVRPNDAKELAKRLDYVISNQRRLTPMKKRAYEEAVSKYDPKTSTKEYERLYKQ